MALGDEQIDRLTNNLDEVLNRRIRQLGDIFDEKIDNLRELINGIKITNSFEAHDVKKAQPTDNQPA